MLARVQLRRLLIVNLSPLASLPLGYNEIFKPQTGQQTDRHACTRSLKSPKWRLVYRATVSAILSIFFVHRKAKVWVGGRIETSDKYSCVVAPLNNHSFGHVLHFPFPRRRTTSHNQIRSTIQQPCGYKLMRRCHPPAAAATHHQM